jgi:putative phosphoesterase
MRIALIADTHMPRGGRRLPERCVEEIRGSDLLLHAGDLSTANVLAELESIGPPVKAVHGNIDSPELMERLPETVTLELEGVVISMLHDAGPAKGRLARMRERFPDADVVVFAHSHLPEHESEQGFQIFNPGSPTERRRAPAHTMGIAVIDHGEINLRHHIL